jgi:hypothetical protein
MTRVVTEMELRVAMALGELLKDAFAPGSRPVPLRKLASAAIRSLRDAPHAVLDQARGSRLASGDAAVFWNAMIDAISPPEGT